MSVDTSRRADEPTSRRADEPTSRRADEPTEIGFAESLAHQHEWLRELEQDPDRHQCEQDKLEACLIFSQELLARCFNGLPSKEGRELLPAYRSVYQSMSAVIQRLNAA